MFFKSGVLRRASACMTDYPQRECVQVTWFL